MALVRRRDPTDRFLHAFFNWPSLINEDDWPMTTKSHLDVYEEGNDVVVEAAVPGADPENLDVSFEEGRLWVKAETSREEEGKHYFLKGRTDYSYSVTVPNIDPASEPVEATTNDGVLTVRFKKAVEKQTKRIEVKSKK